MAPLQSPVWAGRGLPVGPDAELAVEVGDRHHIGPFAKGHCMVDGLEFLVVLVRNNHELIAPSEHLHVAFVLGS